MKKKKKEKKPSDKVRIFVPWNTGTQVHRKREDKRKKQKLKRYIDESH